MKIIDAHMHMGDDKMFAAQDTEADILAYMGRNGIGGVLLQPGLVPLNIRQAHLRIAQMAQEMPEKVWGWPVFRLISLRRSTKG